jgi:hypothetical protein
VAPYLNAIVHIGLGEKEKALQWLEKGYKGRDSWWAFLTLDPRIDTLRMGRRLLLGQHLGLN